MQKQKALRLYDEAIQHLRKTRPDMLERAIRINAKTFGRIGPSAFLQEYCWVVYASGFRFSTVEARFPRIRRAFCNFELSRLARMRSVSRVLIAFNNAKKARSFLAGSKAIAAEGFPQFKNRIAKEGVNALNELPGIGPITMNHLAKNIGLIDGAKADIWLKRAANLCNTTVDQLVHYISKWRNVSNNLVDVAIWHYGADSNFGKIPSRVQRKSGSVRAAS